MGGKPSDASPSRNRPENEALNRTFDALSDPDRRRILTVFLEEDTRDGDSFAPTDFRAEGENAEDPLTRYHHIHFPKLEEAGYIEYDHECNTVSRGSKYDEIEPVVKLLVDHQGELPGEWP